jgi:GPR1/FUN34/yaaH family
MVLGSNKRKDAADLEAANNGAVVDDGVSGDTRTDNQTYQSTILPASATDFDPEPHKRLFRQFGNPAPLGLCGFALTTFVLSLVNVHARSVLTPNIVIGLGIPLSYSLSDSV